MNKETYILGLDGGGTNTFGCLFTNDGFTVQSLYTKGTNLHTYKDKAIHRIMNLVIDLVQKSQINISDVSAFGFGLAGISDVNQRDMFLKELDKLNITPNCLILSDAEAAFYLLCPTGVGLLVSVGTGIICLGRDNDSNTHIIAGKGYKKDIGSGYWIGNQILKQLIINESVINVDNNLKPLFEMVKKKFSIQNLNSIVDILSDEIDSIPRIASLAESIISLSERGNDVALAVVQEATRHISDYILILVDKLKIKNKDIIISGNGSLLKNKYFRNLINQSLEFDFDNIHWVFSDISPAYGAGIMAAAYKEINIPINKIVENFKN